MWLQVTVTRKPEEGEYMEEHEWVVFMDQTQECHASFQFTSCWPELSHRATHNGKGFGHAVKLYIREEKIVLESRASRPGHTSSLQHCLARDPSTRFPHRKLTST